MLHRTTAALTLAAAAALGVTACSDDAEPGVQDAAPAASDVSGVVDAATGAELIAAGEHTVIDVRTPAEYDAGHVADSLNIDVQGADFADRIGELDPEEPYLVYCRSGNRSAAAAEIMTDQGLTVVDAGGFDALAAAGAPTD